MLSVLICFSVFAVINTTPARKELQNAIKEIHKIESGKINADLDKQLAFYSSKLSYDVLHALDGPKDSSSGCACKGYNCGCCLHLEVDEIRLNDTVCANFSYLPAEYGVSVTLTVDNRTLLNKSVSVKNPPPICAGVPYLKEFAELCVVFQNLTVHNKSFSGCVYILAKLEGVKVEKLKVGCFKLPPGSVSPGITTDYKYLQQIESVKGNSGREMVNWNKNSNKLLFKPLRKH